MCLQFSNAISLPVFTGTRIEGEGCTRLEVALIDSLSGEVVSSGRGSSENVEIVVLEGDFDGDERGNWTLRDFQRNRVRERNGKKPLLTGDLIMTLQDGKGTVGNIMFTDNSSWTRSRRFRLGAKISDSIGGIRIREARSEPFVVRDHRGECELLLFITLCSHFLHGNVVNLCFSKYSIWKCTRSTTLHHFLMKYGGWKKLAKAVLFTNV